MEVVIQHDLTQNYWTKIDGQLQWHPQLEAAVRYKTMGGALRSIRAHKSIRHIELAITRVELKPKTAQPLL